MEKAILKTGEEEMIKNKDIMVQISVSEKNIRKGKLKKLKV